MTLASIGFLQLFEGIYVDLHISLAPSLLLVLYRYVLVC
jgi:hypothetical protein